TFRSAGLFRVYFYDDFTRPMPVKGFSGNAVLLDDADKEVGTFALRPTTIRNALDARVTGAKIPVKIKLLVKFKPDDKDRVFDFAFKELSKEPPPAPKATAAPSAAPAAAPPATAARAAVQSGASSESGAPPSAPQTDVPPPGTFGAQVVLPNTKP